MSDITMGIDLGTTNTCVSIYWKGRYEIINNGHGNKTTPSYVTFDEDGILVGEASRDASFDYPKSAIFGIKRILGRRYDDAEVQKNRKRWPFTVVNQDGFPAVQVEQGGSLRNYSPAEISSHLLKHIRDTVNNFTGQDVTKAVITVPASFNDAQRRATQEAGKLAGLDVIGMINEPTAAALAYGLQKVEGEHTILVFDFGGGTLDVAILKVTDGARFETLATAANMTLGGEDFDQKLLERFVQEFKDKNNGIDLNRYPAAITTLRLQCDSTKKTLSNMNGLAYVAANRIYEDRHLKSRVTRAEFEALCENVFAQILEPVEVALERARMDKSDIERVLLVGGSSKMPKVQEILRNFFPNHEINRDISGDEAIAQGAAVYARLLTSTPENPMVDEEGEEMNMQVIERTAHSIGTRNFDGRFKVVVEKGSRIPFQAQQYCSTVRDNQEHVKIKVFEGDSPVAAENEFLGEFTVSGIRPAKAGVPMIRIVFSSDSVGCLTVTAQDEDTGVANRIDVNIHR